MHVAAHLLSTIASLLISQSPPQLQTRVRSLSEHPTLAGPINVEVLVSNVGTEVAPLPTTMYVRYAIDFVVVDPLGERLRFVGPDLSRWTGSDTGVSLAPGHKFGANFNLASYYKFRLPGTYKVSAIYILPENRGRENPVLVRSSSISVEISP